MIRRDAIYGSNNNSTREFKQNRLFDGDHSVIIENNTPTMKVTDYKYPTGLVNPIEKRSISKIMSIDSIFRENYENSSSSNMVWKLPNTEQKVVSLKLVSLELPVMWHSISEKNNSNVFQITTYGINDLADKTHTIKIPSGNYMANDFATTLSNYFTHHEDGLQYLICKVDPITTNTIIRARDATDGGYNIYDIEKSYYSPNFFFKIDFGENTNTNTTCETSNDINFTYSNDNTEKYSQYSLGSFLGFSKRYYTVLRENTLINYSEPTYSGAITYECSVSSESSYGNGRTHYIYVSVDDFNNNYATNTVIASSKNNSLGHNILGRISINETFNSILMDNASDNILKKREYMGPVNLSKLHIKLIDKYGNILDMKNNDISLAMEITVLY